MDSDEPYKQTKNGNNKLGSGDVFQSARIRRIIQVCDGLDGFLLDYGCNFLPYITIISWVIFCFN